MAGRAWTIQENANRDGRRSRASARRSGDRRADAAVATLLADAADAHVDSSARGEARAAVVIVDVQIDLAAVGRAPVAIASIGIAGDLAAAVLAIPYSAV